MQGTDRAGKGSSQGAGAIEVERQVATVEGIMSASEFASLDLTENTRKVCSCGL